MHPWCLSTCTSLYFASSKDDIIFWMFLGATRSLNSMLSNLRNFPKGLEILIAVVFWKECVLPVQWWFLFCKGGEDGRGTDGGGGRAKSRIARPKLIIKSCVNLHMNSNIHHEFPAPLQKMLKNKKTAKCWKFTDF